MAYELQEQIATLAHDRAVALWMRYWDDLAPADIAVRLGRTEQATRKLLFRAIKTLRVRLANDEGLGDDDEARGLGDARGRRQRADGAQTSRPRAALHDIAEVVREPPDPAVIKRIRDALLREHWPASDTDASKSERLT